jgi:hypothetical protein
MAGMPKGRVALIVGALVLAAASGSAQTGKGKGKGPNKAPASAKPPAAQPAPAKEAPPPRTEPETASSVAAPAMTGRGEAKTAPAAKPAPSDAGVIVVEKDGGAKQFRFMETDVEGRLKAPQLVYFLRRVRAEFAAGDLGHRSFMRELSETRRDPNF